MNHPRLRHPNKLNSVDFSWHLVRTLPHQEEKLVSLLEAHRAEARNILEVYCPTHTTVSVMQEGREVRKPLLAGLVFVLSTEQALVAFIERHYPNGSVMYERRQEGERKARFWSIPEGQMRAFKDFNENYADHVIVLERPYSDYAFNAKTGEPNEIIKVLDGPLAGRVGYLTRFRRDKRLVFNMQSWEGDGYVAVSIPHIWDFHVVRLHNAEGDRHAIGTQKGCAADLLIGLLQGCGCGEQTLPLFYDIIGSLVAKPSLTDVSNRLRQEGQKEVGKRMAALTAKDASLLLNLVRYERDNPGYVQSQWDKLILRPFLTPTSGVMMAADAKEAELQHKDFTEVIRRIHLSESVYYPSREQEARVSTPYYAHIGILASETGDEVTLFANWDSFLEAYFQTSGKANERLVRGTVMLKENEEKLLESFRNFSPTLYKVLTDPTSPVRALPDFTIGNESLNVMAATVPANLLDAAKDELIHTCIGICQEINSTTHLAIWRRYLREVWLHV